MISKLSRPRSVSHQLALAVAIIVVTVVALGLAWQARQAWPDVPPLSLAELTAFEYNPYLIGYIFQGIVVPAVLIYLYSTTRLFRRVVSGDNAPGDALKLFGGLALIQLLVLAFDLWRFLVGGEPPTAVLGLLVVVTAGLLGGWRMGLGLGLIVLFFRGTQQLFLFVLQPLGPELRFIFQTGGLGALLAEFPVGRILLDHYVYNLWAMSAVWAGLVAGLCAQVLGESRFSPLAAFALGSGIDLGAGYLTAIAGVPPGVLFLIPSVLVSGVATAAVALIVRNVQAEAAQRKAAAAELALAQAELRALRAQINPHFLFNALNTIRYFVRTDAEAARRLLLNLSEVFQRALRSGEFVPLRDELSYVEAYLALEGARLGERLRVEWVLEPHEHSQDGGQSGQAGESGLMDHQVPTLILQPIVENAIRHGVAKRPEGGSVRITVDQAAGALVLGVQDDGPGIEPDRLAELLAPLQHGEPVGSPETRASIGLRNVDGRLRALYGQEYRLRVEARVGHGTDVQIRIPLKR